MTEHIKEETSTGINMALLIFSRHNLRVNHRQLSAFAYYFEAVPSFAPNVKVDFSLSREFLDDLNGTKSHQAAVEDYAATVEDRCQSPEPNAFLTQGGLLLRFEFYWPPERYGNTALVSQRIEIEHLTTKQLAKCVVKWDHYIQDEYKGNPFGRTQLALNALRQACDAGILQFYDSEEHPNLLQEIDIEPSRQHPLATDDEVQAFLRDKIDGLGFKFGNGGKVWYLDPWDAAYLGVEVTALQQASQILRAQGELILVEKDCAVVGDELLRNKKKSQPIRAAIEPTSMGFSFVHDDDLRRIAERDYAELQRVKQVGAHKSRIVLAGSIMEGLLLDALLAREEDARQSIAAQKEKRPVARWGLATLLDVAVELGVLDAGAELFGHSFREHRNLIHPGLEKEETLKVDEPEAQIAEQVLQMIIRDLSS